MGNMFFNKGNNIGLHKQANFSERHKDDYYMKNAFAKFWETFKPAIILGVAIFCVFKVFILNGFIPSESMEPTLKTGNFVIANRRAYKKEAPRRGDIVVINSEEYGQLLVKRVIGLPGDKIEFRDEKVYINDCLLDESKYAVGKTNAVSNKNSEFVVPEECVFLMGDNRENSADARFWKSPYINYEDLVGRVAYEYSIGGEDGIFFKKIEFKEPSFTVD